MRLRYLFALAVAIVLLAIFHPAKPLLHIFADETAPVRDGELWLLNFR